MSISSNYTSTGYVPTSTSNVSCASGASGASGSSGACGASGVTATSGVATRSSATYTAQAPQTQMTATGPTSSEVTSSPEVTKRQDGVYLKKGERNVQLYATSANGPWSPVDPAAPTQTDPATGRPVRTGDVTGSGNVTGSDNVPRTSPSFNDEKNEEANEGFDSQGFISSVMGIWGIWSTVPGIFSSGFSMQGLYDDTKALYELSQKENRSPEDTEYALKKVLSGFVNLEGTLATIFQCTSKVAAKPLVAKASATLAGTLGVHAAVVTAGIWAMFEMDEALKNQYIKNHGKEKGEEMYNNFHKSLHDVTTGNSAGPSMCGSGRGFMM